MFRELFLFSKESYKKRAVHSFFLFVLEASTVLLLNCGLFVLDEFGVRYPAYVLSVLFAVLNVFLLCVFKAANVWFFFYEKPKDFQKAKRFFGLVFLEFLLSAIKFFVFCVCFFPFALTLFGLSLFCRNGVPLSAIASTASFCASLAFVGAFFYLRISPSFFLAPYLYLNGEKAAVFSSVAQSVLKSEGKTTLILKLKKKFLPLNFLELFILPAGFVWGFRKRTFALFAYGLI